MIGYATLGTNDIGKARGFYDALLGLVGAKRIMEFGDELGGFTMWGTSWDKPGVAVTKPYDKQAATVGNGNMVALTVDQRAHVDARWPIAYSDLEPWIAPAMAATNSGSPIYRTDDPLPGSGQDSEFSSDTLERWANVQAAHRVEAIDASLGAATSA